VREIFFGAVFGGYVLLSSPFPQTASAQNLVRPPQPPSYTSQQLPEALLQFGAQPATEGEELLSSVAASWEGMSQTSTIRPPDPHGAAGPNGILQTVNLRIQYWTKVGTSIWGPVNLSTFWAGVGNTGTGLSDPRVLYDPGAGRFYAIMQEDTTSSPPQAFLNLAVSKNSNPLSSSTTDWYFYRLNISEISGTTTNGADYPGLGFDGQAVYVTYNMYCLPFATCGTFKNCQIVVLDKAAITSGVGTYYQVFTPDGFDNAFTLQPASVLGTNNPGNVAYFGETPLSSSTSVRLWALSDPLGTRTMTSTSVTVPNNGGFIGPGAPQSGTATTIPTLSNRTQGNAFYQNGAVWFCHTAGGSSGKAIVYYYRVNSNGYPSSSPTLAESGGIDGGSGVWTYQVSIGASSNGNVGLVYCQSSSTTYPTIMYTARTPGALSFETPTVLKVSPTFSNSDRWGDYASVTGDPVDNSLWVTHEWSRSSALHDWGTWWGNVSLIPLDFQVSPGTGLSSTGAVGGAFSPPDQTYVLSNATLSSLSWMASKSQTWVSLSATGSTLPAGGSTNVTVSINTVANGLTPSNYTDTIIFTNVTTGSGSTTRPVTLVVQAPISTIFLADFEDGSGGYSADGFTYTASGGLSNLWHGSTRRSASPAHSQYYGLESAGNYDTGTQNAGNLLSPSISLTGVTAPVTLSFKYWLQTENFPGYDLATVELSTNAGGTWMTLATLADSASFVTWSGDISSHTGKDILVRFNFDTIDNFANAYEGWYVDDVTITGGVSPSPFRITSILKSNSDILINWTTSIGQTNALQATAGTVSGNYSTNNFANIFIVTNTVTTSTNYTEVGAATNIPSRFYRVRLVP
jgi:hypothetical protein